MNLRAGYCDGRACDFEPRLVNNPVRSGVRMSYEREMVIVHGGATSARSIALTRVRPKQKDNVELPNPASLRLGDRIRILCVPEADLRQRDEEIADNTESAGWTANTIERIIAQTQIVQISQIDEYGCVWYEVTIIGPDGTEEEHSLIVYDDDTWELVE